jgi:hypothetical protein
MRTPKRTKVDLTGFWNFALDPAGFPPEWR